MSKSLFGSNFANNRDREQRGTSDTNTFAAAAAAVAAARKEQREQEQVRALFELGLLGNSNKPKKREKGRDKDKDKAIPSGPGARVPGLHARKGTLLAGLAPYYLPAGLPRVLHHQALTKSPVLCTHTYLLVPIIHPYP